MTPPTQEFRDDATMPRQVTDIEHQVATLVSVDEVAGQACLRPKAGPDIAVPLDLLRKNDDGTYRLRMALSSVSNNPSEASPDAEVIALHEETLEVGRRTRETGKGLRVSKTVSHTEAIVDEPLQSEAFSVERVARSEIVSEAPPTRQEGETLIIPVIEEVLVVEKRLRVKEEIRITRQRGTTHKPQTFTLRSEHVDTERFDDGAAPDQAGS
jgi:uncharacterized protein (TIGR02271 family)